MKNKIFKITQVILVLTFIGANCSIAQNKDGDIKLPEKFVSDFVKISKIEVKGNEKTKDKIITRELTFKAGDTLLVVSKNKRMSSGDKRIFATDSLSELFLSLKYSRENIINRSLFLTVDLILEQIEGNDYKLEIKVTEKWYVWIFPVFRIDAPNFNVWLNDPDFSQTSYGLFTSHQNLWGLGHGGSFTMFFGSSKQVALGYSIPYVNKKQNIGLKARGTYKNTAVVQYASVNNEREMIYESGSLEELAIHAILEIRRSLYDYGTIKFKTITASISDTMLQIAPNYFPDNQQQISTLNLYLDYYYDTRNNRSYPLSGNYLKVFAEKIGMGILTNDADYFNYGIDFHFYQKLNDRWSVAENVNAIGSSSNDISYYFQKELSTAIRGYDFYTIRGDKLVAAQSNLKYNIIKPNIKKARKPEDADSKFKNLQYAFYLNLFADAGFVRNNYTVNNPYVNEMLYTYGLGLDFVSYYSLVLRFEYAFTSIGSHGFFVAFGMPI